MFKFDNTYTRLPERFFESIMPSPVPAASLVKFNFELGKQLGYQDSGQQTADYFSGNKLLPGAEPIALAYAGHQFAHFVPVLGDGRANLLGEIISPDGKRYDIQLKGSGPTPFSRRGDGRAALGPVLREYLVSEFMFRIGIPTTRSLAAVKSGENVMREKQLPGAVLTRVASSHIRIGTFEYFMARQDLEGLKVLADYTITRHYPEISGSADRYTELLLSVMHKQANLVAKWMSAGFIHGVLNTDNVSIAGETLDYGPCAFMDYYDPDTVYSYIDRNGRYAYSNQPAIMSWNLARFAESILPLLSDKFDEAVNKAKAVLEQFPLQYQTAWLREFSAKFGLLDVQDGDNSLFQEFLNLLYKNQADFTISFRALSSELDQSYIQPEIRNIFRSYFKDNRELEDWIQIWRKRLATCDLNAAKDLMNKTNPVYIPRNHIVEKMITQAYDSESFKLFDELLDLLNNPYQINKDKAEFLNPPLTSELIEYTYCGT